ncbi:hypothetical protein JXA32_00790 [Candidatus Sumerlaeota bacterium]|nr:hypothetical protein [Candidatus Sumerlaeota bacterium]
MRYRLYILTFALFARNVLSLDATDLDYEFFGLPVNNDKESSLDYPEQILQKKGYTLDEETLRSILNEKKDASAIFASFKLIKKEKMQTLIPDVMDLYEHYEEELASKKSSAEEDNISSEEKQDRETMAYGYEVMTEGLRMSCLDCLFTIDNSMSTQKREEYLTRVRYALFEREMRNQKNPPIKAFHALISACRHQNVNIKDDLVLLVKSDRLLLGSHLPIRGLFQQYSDQLSDADLMEMLNTLDARPASRKLFLKKAHDHGLLLDQAE